MERVLCPSLGFALQGWVHEVALLWRGSPSLKKKCEKKKGLKPFAIYVCLQIIRPLFYRKELLIMLWFLRGCWVFFFLWAALAVPVYYGTHYAFLIKLSYL
jgi:hypothetical protein